MASGTEKSRPHLRWARLGTCKRPILTARYGARNLPLQRVTPHFRVSRCPQLNFLGASTSTGVELACSAVPVGIYLLEEAVVDPLSAQSVTLIAGAFTLALATMLIYFIFSSTAKSRSAKSRYRAHSRRAVRTIIVAAASAPPTHTEPAKDLALDT